MYAPTHVRPSIPSDVVVETCWRAVSMNGRVVECLLGLGPHGYQVLTRCERQNRLCSKPVADLSQARVIADAWKARLLRRTGFTEVPGPMRVPVP
jgi:hypothetical protein